MHMNNMTHASLPSEKCMNVFMKQKRKCKNMKERVIERGGDIQ